MTDSFINFAQRLVIVSGASSGIGKACAQLLAELGARILLLGRNTDRLIDVKNSLAGAGHEYFSIDLTQTDLIKNQLQPFVKNLGPVYGLCHSAGVVQFRPLNMTSQAVLADQFAINVNAGIELAKLATHRTLATPGEGSLVFISSICAEIGAAGQIGYCATKGAINAAARAMAVELASRKVRVNSVSPGVIRTEMAEQKSGLTRDQINAMLAAYPLGEGSIDQVARAVVFLLAPQTNWITGIDLKVDGGISAT